MRKSRLTKAALNTTQWIGSTQSIAIHTVIFIACFGAAFSGFVSFDRMLLILTTLVSLEAIYLAIFIQMSVNRAAESLEEVEEDLDEIQEDVGEIQKDIDEIQEDVDELQEDVEEIEESDDADEARKEEQKKTLAHIQENLTRLMEDIAKLQKTPQ